MTIQLKTASVDAKAGRIAMTDPEHYEVCYAINPWMQPGRWADNAETARLTARRQWQGLAEQLRQAGLTVEVIPAAPGLPDLVFPANGAIVMDGRALLARFRYPQRQGEEACFRAFFDDLRQRGLIDEVAELPPGVLQEGAGDCLWDAQRHQFWAAYGPRSGAGSPDAIAAFFGLPVVGLELATESYYHLDTCFCVLSGGELLYYPAALSARSQAMVADMVPESMRIVATADEAAAFSLNAVQVGRDLIMAPPPPRLRGELEGRGYRCLDADLSHFMMSGGAAYCMTLRLDLRSR